MLHPQDKIWTRREEETARAYEAFVMYRDMGPKRSHGKLQQALGKPSGYTRWIEEWSSQHDWVVRAEAYDAHLELQARSERQEEHLKELRAYRERQRQLAKETTEAAIDLLEKCNARLEELDAGEIEPGKLPQFFRAAAHIAEVASNSEAQALAIHELMTLLGGEEA